MAEYIVAMDPSTHADASAAQTAITSTGATISKTYSFSLTYKIPPKITIYFIEHSHS